MAEGVGDVPNSTDKPAVLIIGGLGMTPDPLLPR